jgi:hypothetical protein
MLALGFIALTLVVFWLVWKNLNAISRLILLNCIVYGVLALLCLAIIVGLFQILF